MQALYPCACIFMVQQSGEFARDFGPFVAQLCRNATVGRQPVWQSHNACWII